MRRLARPLVALAAVLVVGGGVAVAYAAIPDSSGAIQSCYRPNGQLRVVDEPADCRPAETSLALGGPTFGYEYSNADFVEIEDTTTVVASLKLPAGRYLVHGKLDLLGRSSTEESFVVCNLKEGGAPGTNLDSMWNTLEPGVPGRLPSESAALQTSLTLPSGGAVLMTCVRPEKDAGALARYRKLDAVLVDGLTTTG
jgi:hypothetical protein